MSRILLIVDDAEFHAALDALLEPDSHETVHAADVAAAGIVLSTRRIDLVVVDGDLSERAGFNAVQLVGDADPDIPVVFVTAWWWGDAFLDHLPDALGAALVVTRPLLPAAFRAQIQNLLLPAPSPGESGVYDDLSLTTALEDFGARLPDQIRSLTVAVRSACAETGKRGARERARDLTHVLRAAAVSHGFRLLAHHLAHVDDQLGAMLDDATVIAREHRAGRILAICSGIDHLFGGMSRALPAIPGVDSIRPAILLLEQDPHMRATLAEFGRRNLVQILPTASLEEALAIARSVPTVDAGIVGDLAGDDPEADGRAARHVAARALRREHPDLPLAFLQSDRSYTRGITAVSFGASVLLPHRPSAEAFAAAVTQLLHRSRQKRPVVLLLDPDQELTQRVGLMLRREHMFVEVLHDAEHLLTALERIKPDLVMLDVLMPHVSGFDICRLIRAMPEWQETAVIFLSARNDPASRSAAFEAGGDDYIVKPVVRAELVTRVQVRIERTRLLRERIERDTLTGLLVRRAFHQRLEQRLVEARNRNVPVGIVLLDIDHFKQVNDTRGHLAGDRVVSGVGEFLAGSLRDDDLRCRWGGDEFALALVGEGGDGCRLAIERLLVDASALEFAGDDDHVFGVTFSAGVAAFPEDGTTIAALLSAADTRLYQAKDAGRNCVR